MCKVGISKSRELVTEGNQMYLGRRSIRQHKFNATKCSLRVISETCMIQDTAVITE